MNNSGGDGTPDKLFQILKDDAVKALHLLCQQIWKTQRWPQDWKRSIFIQFPKKGNAKECSNYHTIVLISHASKVMLKILQQCVNWELPDVQIGFRKGKGTRDQIANICWIIGKAREFQMNIYFCFIDYTKAFDCVDHNKLENSYSWKCQTTLSTSWETCMQLKKQQLEPDLEQWTVECQDGWLTRWNHAFWEKYLQPQICRW